MFTKVNSAPSKKAQIVSLNINFEINTLNFLLTLIATLWKRKKKKKKKRKKTDPKTQK